MEKDLVQYIKENSKEYDTIAESEWEARNTNFNKTIEFKENMLVIDQIFEKNGYSSHSLIMIFLTATVLAVEGLHMCLFSSMIIPLTSLYNLSEYQISLVSSCMFLGVGVGSFISGNLTKLFGRPLMINSFTFIIFLSTLLMAFSNNYITFTFARFFVGFGLGLIVPMTINLLTEFLPIYFRSFVLTCIWISFGAGNIFLLFIMLALMPNLDTGMIKTTLLVSSLLPLFTFIVNFIFLQDSPRNLILRYKDDEAIIKLEKISKMKINDELRSRIIYEIRDGTNKELSSDLKQIFCKKYLLLTVLLSMIWILNSVILYGPSLISTLTMKSLGFADNSSNKDIILNQITITLICLPANIIGGLLSEIPMLGRNKSTILTLILGLIFSFAIIFSPSYYTFCFGISQALLGIGFNINTSYTCEVYPTKIRDQAVGFLFFCTRIGGFSSQILFLYFNGLGLWVPYYFTISFVIINIILVYLLPFETYGQPLDVDYDTTTTVIEQKSKSVSV